MLEGKDMRTKFAYKKLGEMFTSECAWIMRTLKDECELTTGSE